MNLWMPRQTAGSEGREQQVGSLRFVQSLMAGTAVLGQNLLLQNNMRYIQTLKLSQTGQQITATCLGQQHFLFLQINVDSKYNKTEVICADLLDFILI